MGNSYTRITIIILISCLVLQKNNLYISSVLKKIKPKQESYAYSSIVLEHKDTTEKKLVTKEKEIYGIGKTEEEIKKAYTATFKTKKNITNLYLDNPTLEGPNYYAGKINKDVLNNGLLTLNFCRYIAGLPPVEFDKDLIDFAQHGAALVGINKTFGHAQKKPENMNDSFYFKGHDNGTQKSNLSYTWSELKFESDIVISRINGLIFDPGENNLKTLGHRRWLLNPSMGKTGIGYVEYKKENLNYVVTSVYGVDDSSKIVSDNYKYIAWPPNGDFPIQLANFSNYSLPWSISLNPNRYDNEKTKDIVIKVYSERNNLSWTSKPNKEYQLTKHGEYFNIDTSKMGVPFNISFRPDFVLLNEFKVGDVFYIEITGIVSKITGNEVEINYRTRFFDLK